MGKGGQIGVKGIWVKALKAKVLLASCVAVCSLPLESKPFISRHAHVYGLPVGFEKFAQQISAQFDWEFGSKPLEGIK